MAIEQHELGPDYATHPGEMLAERIGFFNYENEDVAMRLGITPKHLSNIVNCKAGITAKTALALERVFPGKSAESWLNGQQRYDLFCARRTLRTSESEMGEASEWLEYFDYDGLADMGYVPALASGAEVAGKVSLLLEFFGCSSISAWQRVYGNAFEGVIGCGSCADMNPGNAIAWLRKGQCQASPWFNRLPKFDRREFKRSLKRMGRRSSGFSNTAFRYGDKAFGWAKELCAKSGVMLVCEPAPPKQSVQSALFWSKRAPCIQVNSNLGTEDEFWFGFACEAQHLLEADGKEAIIDMQEAVAGWLTAQDACDWLLPAGPRCEFMRRGDFSKSSIVRFAADFGVAEGLVVGWLQKQGVLATETPLNDMKSYVEYAVVPLADLDSEYYA